MPGMIECSYLAITSKQNYPFAAQVRGFFITLELWVKGRTIPLRSHMTTYIFVVK